MLLWFTDLMNVTEEVTTHRPNILTLLFSAFIRDDLNAATIGPFIWSLISSLSMTSWHSFKSWQWWFASWCLFTPQKKRPLIGDHIKGPLVAVFRSPLMKALNRSVETLGLWIVTSSVTLIKSVASVASTMSNNPLLSYLKLTSWWPYYQLQHEAPVTQNNRLYPAIQLISGGLHTPSIQYWQ